MVHFFKKKKMKNEKLSSKNSNFLNSILTNGSDIVPTTGSLSFFNSLKCWLQLMFKIRLKSKITYITIIFFLILIFFNIAYFDIDYSKIIPIEPTLDDEIIFEPIFLSSNYSYVSPNTESIKEFISIGFPDNESNVFYVETFQAKLTIDTFKESLDYEDFYSQTVSIISIVFYPQNFNENIARTYAKEGILTKLIKNISLFTTKKSDLIERKVITISLTFLRNIEDLKESIFPIIEQAPKFFQCDSVVHLYLDVIKFFINKDYIDRMKKSILIQTLNLNRNFSDVENIIKEINSFKE